MYNSYSLRHLSLSLSLSLSIYIYIYIYIYIKNPVVFTLNRLTTEFNVSVTSWPTYINSFCQGSKHHDVIIRPIHANVEY